MEGAVPTSTSELSQKTSAQLSIFSCEVPAPAKPGRQPKFQHSWSQTRNAFLHLKACPELYDPRERSAQTPKQDENKPAEELKTYRAYICFKINKQINAGTASLIRLGSLQDLSFLSCAAASCEDTPPSCEQPGISQHRSVSTSPALFS